MCGHVLPQAGGFPQLAAQLDETNEGFDLDGIAALAAGEKGHFWFESRNELIDWLVRRHAASTRRALEIGCGTGFALSALKHALPDARISGAELHSRSLVTARERHGNTVELFQMDARHCQLSAVLDLVAAFDVLEHVEQDEAVLAEIARALVPGGVLIATVPQHPWMWSTADDVARHCRRYRRGELAHKARAAGLRPLYQSSFTTLAFPLMMAARLVERARPNKQSLEELSEYQLNIPPLANRTLRALASIEQALRRLGVPMPFGGSQVMVAQRP